MVSSGDAVISDEALEALLDRSVGTEGKGNGAIKEAEGEGSGGGRDGGKRDGVFKVILEQDSTRNVLQTVDGGTESGDGKKSDSKEQITGTAITAEDITGTAITGTAITGTDITGTDITGTDITGTAITGTAITGTDITAEGIKVESGVDDAENIKPKQMLADVSDPPPAEIRAV